MPDTTDKLTDDTIQVWGRGLSSIRREILFLCLKDKDYASIANDKKIPVHKVKKHQRLAEQRVRKAKKKCPYPKTIEHYPLEWPLELLSIDQEAIDVLHNHDPEINFVKDFFIAKITEFDLREMKNISGKHKAQLKSALNLLELGLSKTATTVTYMYFDEEKRQNLTQKERECLDGCYFGKIEKKVVAEEISHLRPLSASAEESTTYDVEDVEDIISSGLAKLQPQ